MQRGGRKGRRRGERGADHGDNSPRALRSTQRCRAQSAEGLGLFEEGRGQDGSGGGEGQGRKVRREERRGEEGRSQRPGQRALQATLHETYSRGQSHCLITSPMKAVLLLLLCLAVGTLAAHPQRRAQQQSTCALCEFVIQTIEGYVTNNSRCARCPPKLSPSPPLGPPAPSLPLSPPSCSSPDLPRILLIVSFLLRLRCRVLLVAPARFAALHYPSSSFSSEFLTHFF